MREMNGFQNTRFINWYKDAGENYGEDDTKLTEIESGGHFRKKLYLCQIEKIQLTDYYKFLYYFI